MSLLAAPAIAQDMPSGQSVDLSEVLIDRVGNESWLRFRFIAPDITRDGDGLTHADAEADFQVLCDDVALPYMSDFELQAEVVVISLMDRAVPFGTADPDATQFFEAFRVQEGTCVWDTEWGCVGNAHMRH
ncbi:MAG: DUF6497 family protein [Tateyamaria sp.]